MPPTMLANDGENDRSHSRFRRASRLNYAVLSAVGRVKESGVKNGTLTPSADRSKLNPRKVGMGRIKASLDTTDEYKLVPCTVVLKRFSPAEIAKLCSLDFGNETQLRASKANTRRQSTGRSIFPVERFSNVTKRTKGRRTVGAVNVHHNVSEAQQNSTSIVEVSHDSIIALDASTNTETEPPLKTRNAHNRANASVPMLRRSSTRNRESQNAIVAESQAENIPTRRSRMKRNNEIELTLASDASPPKKGPDDHISIIELSVGADEATSYVAPSVVEQPAILNVVEPTKITTQDDVAVSSKVAAKQMMDNPFRGLIISVKQIVPPLTDAGLERLKYPERESQASDARGMQRNSVLTCVSNESQESRKSTNQTRGRSRLTLSMKPQIVFSSPIVEDPEPVERTVDSTTVRSIVDVHESTDEPVNRKTTYPTRRQSASIKPKIVVSEPIAEEGDRADPDSGKRTVDSNANNLLPPRSVGERMKRVFPRTQAQNYPPLPLLIEEEDVDKDDVYEFMSLSQTSDEGKSRKKRGQRRKCNNKGTTAKTMQKKANASKVSERKPAQNPFGQNRKQLASVIKRIGGGPVRSPTTVNYVINLELPETPPVSVSPVRHQITAADVSHEISIASTVPLRATNPAVERLKNGDSLVPKTSTPLIRPSALGTSPHNAASPWRLQGDVIVPRTSYVSRNKEMIPSYESLTDDNENGTREEHPLQVPTSHVTERRRPGAQINGPATAISSPLKTPIRLPTKSADNDIVSEKSFREIERMYSELKATSEMSEKLITVMRRYKAKVASDPMSPPQVRQVYESNMKDACAKLKQWYQRSMHSLNRSMRIINRIQRASDNRSPAHPSPLSTHQQRTVDNFNLSTDRFRTMIDDLQAAMNDSNGENRSPPSVPLPVGGDQSKIRSPATTKPQTPSRPKVADVIMLPHRTADGGAQRNPLMPLNFVPLPQRTSPLLSPLASIGIDGSVVELGLPKEKENLPSADSGEATRRELQYDNAPEDSVITTASTVLDVVKPTTGPSEQPLEKASALNEGQIIDGENIPDIGANEEVGNSSHDNGEETDGGGISKDLFGFEDELSGSQTTQVTLPMPLDISTESLKRRLRGVKRLIPTRSIFRQPSKTTHPSSSGRSSGPTRFPKAQLRVFLSPTKRPQTLPEFVASTPRPDSNQLGAASGANRPKCDSSTSRVDPKAGQFLTTSAPEAPDVSAIEREPNETVAIVEHINVEPEIVLFNTPEESRINRSAHQRTYSRIPKRKKKINIYLANLGLDDDDDELSDEDDPLALSSGAESDGEKKRKKKAQKKKHRRKPKPVEETKEFKQFVQEFNSMCEEVNRFEVAIEVEPPARAAE